MGKNRKRHAESESPINRPQKSTDNFLQKKKKVCEEVSLTSEEMEDEEARERTMKDSSELERKLKKEQKKQRREGVVCTKLPDNTSEASLTSTGMKKMGQPVAVEELTDEKRIFERKLKKERKKKERLGADGGCTEAAHVNSGASLASNGVKSESKLKTEEDLTPEEMRIIERKLKKERKKEEKKLTREGHVDTKKAEPEKPSGCDLALQYLTSWAQKAQNWKFQKTRQTWLLLHMYDSQRISRDHFTVLLDYLEGLKGSARDLTVRKAEAMLKENEANTEDSSGLEVTERARQVIQLLS
ncbi:protein cholesin [Lissotriton helveticus]